MANDDILKALSFQRDTADNQPQAKQDCADVIHISIFFDGTGNNRLADGDGADKAQAKWSNPARIWRSAQLFSDASEEVVYAIYISGVGTQFNGDPLFSGDQALIAVEDSTLGMATGTGGTRRLNSGEQKVNDTLRRALLRAASKLDGEVAKYAKQGQHDSFDQVTKKLAKHHLIKQINVSIFGFSRGAALARAFCNQWLWQCKGEGNNLKYAGHPIRFNFLGVFDTVASFGIPSTNLANNPDPHYGGFKGRDMVVDPRVERCVHFVSAHELRFAFPVDLIRKDGKLRGNWLEKTYPGVHSDVGGGYEPHAQAVDNNYARIPMRDMMKEAVKHGVRIYDYDELKKEYADSFKSRFECLPETEKAYAAYKAVCSPSGTIEQQMQKHMAVLYSAYGTLHRKGIQTAQQRQRAETFWKRIGPDDMATELESYERARKITVVDAVAQSVMPIYSIVHGGYTMWIKPEKWQLTAWKTNATDDVAKFVHDYIHDSKVDFVSNLEPFSYFSSRGVSESMHSMQGWYEENYAKNVDHVVDKTVETYNKAEKSVVEGYNKTEKVVVDGYNTTSKYAVQKIDQGANAINSTAKTLSQASGEAADVVVEKSGKAVNYLIKGTKTLWPY